jgi:hypothetical protein
VPSVEREETRLWTITIGCFSIAALGFFLAVYAPAALAARPGASFRPMTPVPLLAAMLGIAGWIPAIVMGVRQLFWKPRVYGVISIAIGVLHFAGFWVAEWLLMTRRGITWGS